MTRVSVKASVPKHGAPKDRAPKDRGAKDRSPKDLAAGSRSARLDAGSGRSDRSAQRARRSSVRRARKQAARAQTPMAFWVILATVGILCLLGLIMVLSVTTVKSTYEHNTAGYFFNKQAIYLGVGAVLMFLGYKFGYRRVSMFAPAAMGVSIGLLVAVLFLGDRVNGSRRWFDISFFNVQPSEIAKLAVILWSARLLANRAREMHDWRRTILPVGLGVAVTAVLTFLEPDLGTVVVMVFVTAVILVVAGARLDKMAILALPAIGLILLAALTGYHADRWGFLNPTMHGDTTNYQLVGSLSSISNGGWFGVGPGASMAKWGFLPEAHTDAIFAVIAEEMGVIGALAVIGMYVVLLGAGLRVAREAATDFGRLLAIGISSLVAVQAFVNIGVALGVLPNKGFTLPFVSYGGSSLLVMMFAVGLLLSIAREGSAQKAHLRRRAALEQRSVRRAPKRGRLVLVTGDGRRPGAARTGVGTGARTATRRAAPKLTKGGGRAAAPGRAATRSTSADRQRIQSAGTKSRVAKASTVKASAKSRSRTTTSRRPVQTPTKASRAANR